MCHFENFSTWFGKVEQREMNDRKQGFKTAREQRLDNKEEPAGISERESRMQIFV